MPMTHVPEIRAENWYHKLARKQSMSYSLLVTGTRKKFGTRPVLAPPICGKCVIGIMLVVVCIRSGWWIT